MSVTLVTRKATPTTQAMLPLKFSCKGDALVRCTIKVLIDYQGTPIGKKSFGLYPGKLGKARVNLVKVKLTAKAFRLLLSKKKLGVDVTFSVRTGVLQGSDVDDKVVTLSAPRMPKPVVKAPKRR
jgi:hypothetical protein